MREEDYQRAYDVQSSHDRDESLSDSRDSLETAYYDDSRDDHERYADDDVYDRYAADFGRVNSLEERRVNVQRDLVDLTHVADAEKLEIYSLWKATQISGISCCG